MDTMGVEGREGIAAFRKRQADLRDSNWAKAITRARWFTGEETLRQGLSFSEDAERILRGWKRGGP